MDVVTFYVAQFWSFKFLWGQGFVDKKLFLE
jgi:hypothetical protein